MTDVLDLLPHTLYVSPDSLFFGINTVNELLEVRIHLIVGFVHLSIYLLLEISP